jgi:hypothetical protein
MLRGLLLSILDWIRVKLDPEYGARIEAYKAQRRVQEEQVEQLKGDILAGETQINELGRLRDKMKIQLQLDAEEIKNIDAQIERVKNAPKPDIPVSDGAAVRGDF